MKKYLFILISSLAVIPVFSQNVGMSGSQRLHSELSLAKHDTTRALIMAELAESYRGGTKQDSTFYYGQRALALSRSINFPKGEVRALLAISIYFTITSNLPKSLEAGLKALQIAQQHNLKTDQAFALIRLGNVYLSRINYREALTYYQRANKVVADGSHPFFYAVTYWLSSDVYEKIEHA